MNKMRTKKENPSSKRKQKQPKSMTFGATHVRVGSFKGADHIEAKFQIEGLPFDANSTTFCEILRSETNLQTHAKILTGSRP